MKIFNPKPSELPDILAKIEATSGYVFKKRDLLVEALTHPSYASEHAGTLHNQRLEFLGDAVLQIAVSTELYKRLPESDEGVLTRIRSLMAKEHATAVYARKLHLDEGLLLGKGENMTGGRQRESILGDAFEAFLGAVYVDSGYQASIKLFKALMPDVKETLAQLQFEENPKGTLQEMCQTHYHCKPDYVVVKIGGSCHEPLYEVRVSLSGEQLAVGQGSSKKSAERAAASEALKILCDRLAQTENPSLSGQQ